MTTDLTLHIRAAHCNEALACYTFYSLLLLNATIIFFKHCGPSNRFQCTGPVTFEKSLNDHERSERVNFAFFKELFMLLELYDISNRGGADLSLPIESKVSFYDSFNMILAAPLCS